ncbi:hypothetical protein RND71_009518 [Anisodus tanguticus]|uniref:Uncharacterized protein n=1 Tax=Anisodus tanguticus TaxID=243964 RepID=A0AAE1VHA5_9SOLA|nr:hypothetical protein RND71_009518 [Anisodus tanguticus]
MSNTRMRIAEIEYPISTQVSPFVPIVGREGCDAECTSRSRYASESRLSDKEWNKFITEDFKTANARKNACEVAREVTYGKEYGETTTKMEYDKSPHNIGFQKWWVLKTEANMFPIFCITYTFMP